MRAVTRAVESRLGGADLDTVRVVVREVVAAVGRGAAQPPRPTRGLVDNGDGSVTTGLGARLPLPAVGKSPPGLCVGCVEQTRRDGRPRNRAVVTATGPNRRGVIARLTTCIAELGGNIEDVSQTIVSDYFTLIFLVDLAEVAGSFADLKRDVEVVAEELGIRVTLMHEDVMRALQRI